MDQSTLAAQGTPSVRTSRNSKIDVPMAAAAVIQADKASTAGWPPSWVVVMPTATSGTPIVTPPATRLENLPGSRRAERPVITGRTSPA